MTLVATEKEKKEDYGSTRLVVLEMLSLRVDRTRLRNKIWKEHGFVKSG
jgi:hypothetical protein